MNKKVMIIACYYGKLPGWFNLWLLSCKYNPEFHFMLVTDQVVIEPFPTNVFLMNITLEELRQRFSRILGFSAALSDGYKLCDYRPLYGLAFQEILLEYDYWGHCDIDLIWGNLRKFISEEVFENYVRIGEFGHLTLYRNTEQINNLFIKHGSVFSFDTVFKDKAHYGFDEMMGMNRICRKNKIDFYKIPIADANWLRSRITVAFQSLEDEVYFWHEGRVYRAYKDGEESYKMSEYAYLHFQKKRPVCYVGENYENGFFIKAKEFKPFYWYPLTLHDVERESEFRTPFFERMDWNVRVAERCIDFLFGKNMHQKKILLKKGVYNEIDKIKRKL